MARGKKEWNGNILRSEDFVGALEGEIESFMENGDVTPNQLKERCLELTTALANWIDELQDSIEQKDEKIEKLESETRRSGKEGAL